MKYQTIILAALAASPALSAPSPAPMVEKRAKLFEDIIEVAEDVLAKDGGSLFNDASVPNILPTELSKRQEVDPDRNVTTPEFIFVVQCVDAGFRGDCLVFGAAPGDCVSYFDYDGANSTAVSDTYNNQISSLSTNTGGVCQFYKYVGCNNKGDDPGVTLSYLYDLAVVSDDPDYSADYENFISSWRYEGCNNKGDDRGLTSSYNYNFAVALEEDPRTVEYENQITSWRC